MIHGCLLNGTDISILSDDSLQKRLQAHVLVDMLPNEGVAELVQELDEMCKFYTSSATTAPALPAARSVKATVARTYIRPEFHVEEGD